MEASSLRHAPRVPVLTGISPHLRLQSDERLVALVRRGHQGAFEALLKRYQPRLLAFCRHLLGSTEDAEDVMQEVFASAYRAMCADDRPINTRPWLYRIARNRCLNHLRKPRDAGQESMDVFERESGATVADTVHRREEFRQILVDVHGLPEAQRTALLLREIDTLTYDQIAVAMETTVASVKSLLVRARMSLAEASEARLLTCAEVRLQLTQAAEGIAKPPAPTRRHVRSCARCRTYRRELRRTTEALAAVSPVGPVMAALHSIMSGTAGAGKGAAGGSSVAGGSTVAGGVAVGGGGTAGLLSVAGGSLLAKTAAGLVTAAIVTAGAAEIRSGGLDTEPEVASPTTIVPPTNDSLRPIPPVEPTRTAAHHPAPAQDPVPIAESEPTTTTSPVRTQQPAVPPPEVAPESPPAPTTGGTAPPPVDTGPPSAEGGPAPTFPTEPPSEPDDGGFPTVTEPPPGSSDGGGETPEPPPEGAGTGDGSTQSG